MYPPGVELIIVADSGPTGSTTMTDQMHVAAANLYERITNAAYPQGNRTTLRPLAVPTSGYDLRCGAREIGSSRVGDPPRAVESGIRDALVAYRPVSAPVREPPRTVTAGKRGSTCRGGISLRHPSGCGSCSPSCVI